MLGSRVVAFAWTVATLGLACSDGDEVRLSSQEPFHDGGAETDAPSKGDVDGAGASSDTGSSDVPADIASRDANDVDRAMPIDASTIDAPTIDASTSDGPREDGGPIDTRDTIVAYTGSGAAKGVNATTGSHNSGRQFRVTTSGITVVDLGVWDQGADGLVAAHTVTLFSLDKVGSGAVAKPVPGGSVVVPAGNAATLKEGFRFAPLGAPIDLAPGAYAVVAYGLDDRDPYGDGGNVPLSSTGVADAKFDVFQVTTATSPAYPTGGDANSHASASFRFKTARGKFMRIMPLGASITEGVGSTGGGYRLPLSRLLADRGIAFQFVGSLAINAGALSPDELHHEGHSGSVITAGTSGRPGITDSIGFWLGPSGVDPDVILLLVGTNDCDLDYKLSEAPDRMDHLLTMILDKTTGLKPKARLVLARLPPIADATEDARVVTYNDGIAAVAARHKAAGEIISVVDMHPVVAPTDMFDKLHPKDSGYAKMAPLWLDAIVAP